MNALDLAAAERLVGALRTDDPEWGDGDAGAPPRIAGYTILGRVGCGGGGVVYEAVAAASECRVALKVLSQPLRPGAASARAWRELDLLSQLRLTVVPRVLDYGVYEGRLYIVTEFVDGNPLDAACGLADPEGDGPGPAEGTGLPLRERVAVLAKAAEAVQVLHEHGVIHRDLKPSNILLDVHGNPVILDLGVATAFTGDLLQTIAPDGAAIGTPAFMAPEQARGDRDEISTRSDVYALGATAYLLLTGRTPHDLGPGTTVGLAEGLRRVAEEPPRDPRAFDPALPRPLAAVLLKAVDPSPARRYDTAAGLAADLRRWLAGEPVSAAAPTGLGRVVRWMARYPIRAAAAVWALALVVMIAANLIGIRLLYSEPYAARISDADRSRVELRTISGHVLASWEGGDAKSVRFADLAPGGVGGVGGARQVVLIGWCSRATHKQTARLCAYDASNPARLLWEDGGAPLAQPRPSPDPYEDAFRFHSAFLADVFEDNPGPEIVAVYTHTPFSPSAIRIYSTSGEVLYEVWHDGLIYGVHWLSGPGVLVSIAANCDQRVEALGLPASHEVWPPALFGLRPRMGERLAWIRTPDGIGTETPAWYKFLAPPEIGRTMRIEDAQIHAPTNPADRGRLARIALLTSDGGPKSGCSIFVDGDGEIRGSYQDDRYVHGERVPVAEFRLWSYPTSPDIPAVRPWERPPAPGE